MGNFYVNYTLRGPSQQAVADKLRIRRAIVTRSQGGCVIVLDEESDEQDQDIITELAADLSTALDCPVLAVLNHDDDIFWYQLHHRGELLDEYDSSPGYFDSAAEPSPPIGGNAQLLCSVFGASDVAKVESILRKSFFEPGGYAFAVQRHMDLASALGMPSFGVGLGYNYVANGDLPQGLTEADLLRTS